MRKIFYLLIICLVLLGCSKDKIDGEVLYKTIENEIASEFVNDGKAILIDVRSYEEYEKSHIENAINMPLDTISKESLKAVTGSKTENIIVYCQSGARSKEAAIKIIELGYTNVYDLGSINNWEIDKGNE